MYPWELKKFIEERNNVLGGDDLQKATSPYENPQLKNILYDPNNHQYQMWDNEGNYYKFRAIPYEEAKQKGLVKTLDKK
jgi:hypothetical protein